jgi:zeta toxin-like protein
MNMEKGLSLEDALGHYEAVRDLKIYLNPEGPNATINNPDWYTKDPKERRLLSPTPQREALQDSIKEKIFGDLKPSQGTPVGILLAGPPGAGKSTLLKKLFEDENLANPNITGGLKLEDFVVIDADNIKTMLLEQASKDGSLDSFIKPASFKALEDFGVSFSPLEFASLVHEESSMIAKDIQKNAIAGGYNVIFDQVCSNQKKVEDLVEQLSAEGYYVSVVEIHADFKFSEQSAFNRTIHALQDGRSARYVPTEVVKDMYDEQGFSKVRSSIQNLLDKKMCKVSAYIGCYAQDLRSKLPLKLAKGLRSKDGTMHVENGLQNTRSNGESEKEKYLKNIQMLPKAALQGKPQKATNPVNKNAGAVLKAPTVKPSADKPNNIKR